MKRGTPDHPKIRRLAKILNISRTHAVGIVECLFHFTMEHAPQGNVGKWTDEEIADGIGWETDPKPLIDALLAAGWLDADDQFRLLVHDWADHADRGVRMRLKNRGLCLLGAHNSKTSAQYKTTTTTTTAPTTTTAEGAQQANGEVSSVERWEARPIFDALKPSVPSRLRPGPTAIVDAIAEKLRDGVDGQHIIDRAARYYASPHSRGECPWRLKAFVRDGHYDDERDAWEVGPVKPPDPLLTRTPAEDAEVQARILRERALR